MTNDAHTRAEMPFAKRYNLFFWFRHAALMLWALMIMFPIFWMISTSFKDSGDWLTWPPNWFPSFLGGGYEPTLDNYRLIFSMFGHGDRLNRDVLEHVFTIWGAVRDSMVVSSISALIALLLGAFLAYSISRFNVGGKYFRYMILTIRMV
ncbi:MAG: carbohydrate ABC transporter permease, partial [Nitrospinae bacterium]|nr:carbohydrate ABC transporter permease [Nitrospinota bacterium]